ncbi:MAG TPA: hypothetical protein VMT32_10020 [Bryobacteraceae bacterium]|nr:hypothetical protein [Bryobacteraceae bacterium]
MKAMNIAINSERIFMPLEWLEAGILAALVLDLRMFVLLGFCLLVRAGVVRFGVFGLRLGKRQTAQAD